MISLTTQLFLDIPASCEGPARALAFRKILTLADKDPGVRQKVRSMYSELASNQGVPNLHDTVMVIVSLRASAPTFAIQLKPDLEAMVEKSEKLGQQPHLRDLFENEFDKIEKAAEAETRKSASRETSISNKS